MAQRRVLQVSERRHLNVTNLFGLTVLLLSKPILKVFSVMNMWESAAVFGKTLCLNVRLVFQYFCIKTFTFNFRKSGKK